MGRLSRIIRVGSKRSHMYLYKREIWHTVGHVKMEQGEIWRCWTIGVKLEEARDGLTLLGSSRGGTRHCQRLDFSPWYWLWISGLQSCKSTHFCCFKPRSVWICYDSHRKMSTHTIQTMHLKCTIQLFLVYSLGCATITTVNSRTFHHPHKEALCPLAVTLVPSTPQP